ncbi:energy transducer TonB [Rhodanobacter sp. DHB23]|uniref:energy transducer TonB family protein n=1 Tax=Rhodanobacter sp. DHB23 TaxID=2775923 RepID=UPI0017825ADE|nr:energy transducer TonB [Rhodanobacter sp. DHB23]MBD8871273.1 energy transducer TonB [Rhodanobacter sp. DHB23]
MLRLRTTTTLSLLALGIGIAGTQWLCGFNTGWAGPSERVAGFVPAAHHPAARVARHHAASQPHAVAVAHRTVLPPVVDVAQAAPAVQPPELVPVSMPQMPVSWSQMEGHLQGRVLLHLTIDGSGRVAAASLAESSGDPVLDAHALDTVRRWRFAVPADHPDGFSGDLPMSFTRGGQQVAAAP